MVHCEWLCFRPAAGPMKTAIPYAIIAALPREVRGLVGKIQPEPGLLRRGIHLYRLPTAVVVTAGMGDARASLAFAAVLETSAPGRVISAGLAGGCGVSAEAGSVYEAGMVIHAQTGERFRTVGEDASQVLVTTATIAGVREKARLAASYGATMVDMEAATIARLAVAHGLRFQAVKAISDAHDFELVSLSRFAGNRGQFRTAAFAMHTALRPHHWRHAARLGRTSSRALKAMDGRLWEIISSNLSQT